MIPRKLYMRLTDMAEELANDPKNTELDRQLDAFMDEIGWPWKASQGQVDDWNSKNWEPKMETRTPIADRMIKETLRGSSPMKVVEKETEVNPFAGSGAGVRQREAMLRWAEIKDRASQLRAELNQLDEEAKEIAEELGMVGIIERMDEQIAYLDEIEKKITLLTKPNPKYAELWKKLRERIVTELGEQADAIAALMDAMLEAHQKETMSTSPVLRKFSKADIKKRGVGEASIGGMLKGVWNKVKNAVRGLFKRSDRIDADLAKLDQMVSGQTERRRPRRRRIGEGRVDDLDYSGEELAEEWGISTDQVLDLMNRLADSDGSDEIDTVLGYANDLIGGYGVESIRARTGQWDRFWGDTVALYVNRGDTYDVTVVYDAYNDTFYIGSWGDWFEEFDVQNPEIFAERRRPRRRRIKEQGGRSLPFKLLIYVDKNEAPSMMMTASGSGGTGGDVDVYTNLDPAALEREYDGLSASIGSGYSVRDLDVQNVRDTDKNGNHSYDVGFFELGGIVSGDADTTDDELYNAAAEVVSQRILDNGMEVYDWIYESRRPRRRRIREDAFGAIPDAGADPMMKWGTNSMVFEFDDGQAAQLFYETVRNKLAGLPVDWPMIAGLPGERVWTVQINGVSEDREKKLLKSWAGEFDGSVADEFDSAV